MPNSTLSKPSVAITRPLTPLYVNAYPDVNYQNTKGKRLDVYPFTPRHDLTAINTTT